MKNTFFAFIALLILLSSSCARNNNPNSWIFRGTSYGVRSCDTFSGGMMFININERGKSPNTFAPASSQIENILSISFASGHPPDASGIFTVTEAGFTNANQAEIVLNENINLITPMAGFVYVCTGGNGTNQTIRVTVSPDHVISISGSGIMMQNASNLSDSSVLDFNVIQTN
jgi:hypothetical protein